MWIKIRKRSSRRRFEYVADAQKLPFKHRRFNKARAIGFLRHMDADGAVLALKEIHRCIKPKNRITLFEPVWPKRGWARPLAWLILRWDRGSYIRTEEKLRAFCTRALKGNWQFHRITSAYTGLECLGAVFSGESSH